MRLLKPRPLHPGAAVRVVAPASPFPRDAFEVGAAVLARRYRLVYDDALFANDRYLAGSDAHRASELRRAFHDLDAHALFAARGGYGVMRLLPELAIEQLPPKPVVGFSDLTALHLALQRADRVSVHGPVLTQLGRQGADVADRLFHLLESSEPAPPLKGTRTVTPGVAEGPLLGGNLAVLASLIGTPYLPPLEGAILLLEDVGERPYRLDRMWTHLVLSGVLRGVAGIALGDFTDCDDPERSLFGPEVMAELAATCNVPCLGGLPVGHGAINQPVPLGCRVRLDASARRLEFLEAAVA